MKKLYIGREFSKSARDVLATARRKGFNDDGYSEYQAVYEVPFDKAFTKMELRAELSWAVEELNDQYSGLKLKTREVKVVKGGIIELDSTNMSHAGAYYYVVLEVPERVAIKTDLDTCDSAKEIEV